MPQTRSTDAEVDVRLVLEGTYPFVRGGVSSWVHRLIVGMPHVSFGVTYLGWKSSDHRKLAYELPSNVLDMNAHFLGDSVPSPTESAQPGLRSLFKKTSAPFGGRTSDAAQGLLDGLHRYIRGQPDASAAEADAVLGRLGEDATHEYASFVSDPRSWEFLRQQYSQRSATSSFPDYLWTVRSMHAPLFRLAEVAKKLPPCRVIHTACTGYAGFLASVAARKRGVPLLLSEHGLYARERKIDLNVATWIPQPSPSNPYESVGDAIRRLWTDFFAGLARLTYQTSSTTVSLFESARSFQLQAGAPEARTRVIPNGIQVERFQPDVAARRASVPQVVGFIGRLVPIKDLKTFIVAIEHAVRTHPGLEAWIVGSDEESPEYAEECRQLVADLGLESSIKFLGFRNTAEILPQLGVLMLTSISEGQPLTILEAFAAGVPVVATDVGGCRELIEGNESEVPRMATAGRVVPIATPQAAADAALELLQNESHWQQARDAGLERVHRLYTEKLMISNYANLYKEHGVWA